jgi:hypothetical protein
MKRTSLQAARLLSIATILATLLAAGCAELTSHQKNSQPQTISFNSSKIGKAPSDFTTALTGGGGPVSWVVREDATSPDGRYVLAQESAEQTEYRFPLCVYDKFVARDVAVETTFMAISGKMDEAGGVVLRYTPENYYIARANALENNVILFKTVNGKRSKIEEVPVPVNKGEWHTLRFEAKRRHLTIIFDGKTVIDRDDDTFFNAGKVGYWTKADSVTEFGNLKITPIR